MMLFIGVGTSMAQDKKAADSDAAEPVKTEMSAKKECSKSKSKACCAKKGASASASSKECSGKSKTACAPGCEKACCTADAGKARKD